MFRTYRRLQGAAVDATVGAVAAAATAAPPPAADSAPAASKQESKKRVSKLHSAFRPLPIHSWERYGVVAGSNESIVLDGLSFHGAVLGPRPLVILGGSIAQGAGAAQAERFSNILSQVAWPHGAIHIPMIQTARSDTLLTTYCNQVAKVLDVLGVGWTHVLAHSLGALVAAKLAFTHPTRLGTILSLDSPIVEKQWIANHLTRGEIAKADEDVNVPQQLLAFRKETLISQLEKPLTAADASDASLFADDLFGAERLYGKSGGLVRCDDAYLNIDELRCLRHPLQLIVPADKPVCDVATHREFFNLRRVQPIKAATSHDALFSSTSGAAEEVGSLIDQWLHRFEPDTVIARRLDGSVKDMKTRMQTQGGGAAPAAAAEGQATKGGKKEKKKK